MLIIETLSRHGVTDICIAPGSRSTPLTLAAQAHGKLTIHTHFDERGLGFLALGLAKASHKQVAVITTSGTAVANLLPAVAEAHLTGEQLVLLTADRPQTLVDVGANQAIIQPGIFSSHVSNALNLPSPSQAHSPAWLVSSIDAVLFGQHHGSVHINCPFPEPLYGDEEVLFTDYLAPVATWLSSTKPFYNVLANYSLPDVPANWTTIQHQRGVVIAGKLSPGELSEVKVLARRLGWPLLADPQSGGSSAWAGYDVWLNNPDCDAFLSQAEVVLQFGGRLVSKRLGAWLGKFSGEYWLIDPSTARLQPQHRPHTRIQASASDWVVEALCLAVEAPEQRDWAARLAALPTPWENDALNELSFAEQVPHWLVDGQDLFIGNSLVVRLIDMLASEWQAPVFTNRGASGIDGLIATAAGVARARQRPLLTLIGDTSLLYDLNSLALLKATSQPMVIVVLNNDGGGIFDMLPVPQDQKEALYRMPHGLSFSAAAAMFGLNYVQPTSLIEAEEAIQSGLAASGATLIEIVTPSGEAGALLKQMMEEVRHAPLLS
uniref:2-succinyl-5-enolpyruvyl-6-hydroxy-3- cyclohexene-1-carboxylic-acid synthase n=1 Tax=Thaumasiovibrio occultus TaxID=1891184 RepID=UPI000B357D03|nr:2-succinyl-5-enolpyruvyl-6-hydroxy-3-cyclohexene-1-carboxylic-acid synthase [Thaumasiovibrio occultus]